jgi:Domain of unknown function (DUF4878)
VSDVLRRRIAAGLLILGIVIAVLAIRDVGPLFDDPVTEEERVSDTVERFFAAAASGDSQTFCDLLTADAREELRVATAQRLQVSEPPPCTEILDVLAPLFADSTIVVLRVSVSGNRARVEADYKLKGGAVQPRTVLLLAEGGEWHISDPG